MRLQHQEPLNVFGFREALASAHSALLPGGVNTRVVSLPALALLKIVCWADRHYAAPRKDAQDLQLILRTYLQAGNEQRLWNEFPSWTLEDAFQYDLAGARMLGHDLRALLDDEGVRRIDGLLSVQADPGTPAHLPIEMDSVQPERARALIEATLRGLREHRSL